MIFKTIERQRLHKLFGQYVSKEKLDEILADYITTEWEAFKMFTGRFKVFSKPDVDSLYNLKHSIEEILEKQENSKDRQ